MLTQVLLDSYLGRHISEVCPNGYADDDNNHCAHFVNHVLNLSFGATCQRHTGANLRVHETFALSPNTRELTECPVSIEALIFISAPQNFIRNPDGTESLNNVPRKHIGLFLDGVVWHYSNSRRQVVKQILAEFIRHYPSQVNALWVGDLPPGSAPVIFSPGRCPGPEVNAPEGGAPSLASPGPGRENRGDRGGGSVSVVAGGRS